MTLCMLQAILLCEYLSHVGPTCLRGARVIELGAGTGLVGFVASALGKGCHKVMDRINIIEWGNYFVQHMEHLTL